MAMTVEGATPKFIQEMLERNAALKQKEAKNLAKQGGSRDNISTIQPDMSAKADPNGQFYLVGGFGGKFAQNHTAPGPVDAVTGHMGDRAYNDMLAALSEAARSPVGSSAHSSAANRASDAVSGRLNELQNIKSPADAKQVLRSEAANALHSGSNQISKQVAIESGALLRSLTGMSKVQEGAAIAAIYAMEQSLAAKAITVVSQIGVDKVATSLASKAQIFADKAGLGAHLDSACAQLKSANISREAIKDFVGKHAGKFNILLEVSGHSDKLLALAAHSGGLVKLVKDEEFRSAVFEITKDIGKTAAMVPGGKGLGSAAIVVGSMGRGESTQDTAAHLFRAACAIGGGAALGFVLGSAAGASTLGVGAAPAAIGGAVIGQTLGDAFADFVLEKVGYEFSQESTRVDRAALGAATNTLGRAAAASVKERMPEGHLGDKVASAPPGIREILSGDRGQEERVRQLSKSS